MELSEKAEELLESIWIRTQEVKEGPLSKEQLEPSEHPILEDLEQAGYVSIEQDRIDLTEAGRAVASNVVRRHRLAERLLVDVLGTGDIILHEKACKFEHLLDKGLDEQICILLGHPKICPHGSPIPPGRCCFQNHIAELKIVSPLSELEPGQRGKVAYVYAQESDKLQKLMAMGILPGSPLMLIQRFPSFVFQIGQTQFAVDKKIADAIYVRLVSEERPVPSGQPENPPAQKKRKRRFRFRLRGRDKLP